MPGSAASRAVRETLIGLIVAQDQCLPGTDVGRHSAYTQSGPWYEEASLPALETTPFAGYRPAGSQRTASNQTGSPAAPPLLRS